MKENETTFTWQTYDDGATSTIGAEIAPDCSSCPYNSFRGEPDSSYTLKDGEPIES